jgi:hypothetical protein
MDAWSGFGLRVFVHELHRCMCWPQACTEGLMLKTLIAAIWIVCRLAKWGPNVIFCMSNRTQLYPIGFSDAHRHSRERVACAEGWSGPGATATRCRRWRRRFRRRRCGTASHRRGRRCSTSSRSGDPSAIDVSVETCWSVCLPVRPSGAAVGARPLPAAVIPPPSTCQWRRARPGLFPCART